jgi:two-component system, OmpR family, response regulator VicR
MSKILIVDDQEDILETTKTILEKEKYEVITAINVEKGLKLLDSEKPDLVLLDLMMPDTPINKFIKSNHKTKIIIFSIIDAKDIDTLITDEEMRKDMKSPNIVDYVKKPFANEELLNKIKKHIK